MKLSQLIRPNVKTLRPFSSARSEYDGDAEIFLDANENPFDNGINRYPDPYQVELKKRIGERWNVAPKNIFLSNGSDEAIDLIVRTFCRPGTDRIRYIYPSFGMYQVVADINDVGHYVVELGDNFNLDIEACIKDQQEEDKVLFLCSPNNPTGNVYDPDTLQDIIRKFKGIVVVDEAYIQFADKSSLVEVLDLHPNLLVLQTFSKAFGAAGLRVGMVFGSAEILSYLNKMKMPYNISTKSIELVDDILSNWNQVKVNINLLITERKKLFKLLQNIKTLEHVYPSDTNFFLVKFKDPMKAYHHLSDGGIVVRDRSKLKGCEGCLRISLGTPEQNKLLVQLLEKYEN